MKHKLAQHLMPPLAKTFAKPELDPAQPHFKHAVAGIANKAIGRFSAGTLQDDKLAK